MKTAVILIACILALAAAAAPNATNATNATLNNNATAPRLINVTNATNNATLNRGKVVCRVTRTANGTIKRDNISCRVINATNTTLNRNNVVCRVIKTTVNGTKRENISCRVINTTIATFKKNGTGALVHPNFRFGQRGANVSRVNYKYTNLRRGYINKFVQAVDNLKLAAKIVLKLDTARLYRDIVTIVVNTRAIKFNINRILAKPVPADLAPAIIDYYGKIMVAENKLVKLAQTFEFNDAKINEVALVIAQIFVNSEKFARIVLADVQKIVTTRDIRLIERELNNIETAIKDILGTVRRASQ